MASCELAMSDRGRQTDALIVRTSTLSEGTAKA